MGNIFNQDFEDFIIAFCSRSSSLLFIGNYFNKITFPVNCFFGNLEKVYSQTHT
jgi:hypothetical protein